MKVYVGERDVLSVRGDDATSYLQGQISQDLLGISVGESAWSLILQPQGKVDAWFRITKSAEDLYVLDIDAGFGEVLLARVKRFMLRVKVELDLQTWTLHAYDEVVERAPGADGMIVAASADGRGVDIIGPDLDAPVADVMSPEEYAERRILGGIPAMGSELDESTIPAESGVVAHSVSFTKGCFTGQELVARVDSRGDNTPRRLRIVSGAGMNPGPGEELELDNASVGVLTSVAPTKDGWVALAYVRRKALDRSELSLSGAPVMVRATPWDSA